MKIQTSRLKAAIHALLWLCMALVFSSPLLISREIDCFGSVLLMLCLFSSVFFLKFCLFPATICIDKGVLHFSGFAIFNGRINQSQISSLTIKTFTVKGVDQKIVYIFLNDPQLAIVQGNRFVQIILKNRMRKSGTPIVLLGLLLSQRALSTLEKSL